MAHSGEFISIFNLPVNPISNVELLHWLKENSNTGYALFANVHMAWVASHDPDFQAVADSAAFVLPDGMPVAWYAGKKAKRTVNRVAGMDFFPQAMKFLHDHQIPVFFYGNTGDVLKELETRLRQEFTGFPFAGSYSPPFRPLSVEEEEDVRATIRNSGAQVVFVSLGCPKQEFWMYRNYPHLNARLLGVGNAFLTYIGYEKRPPEWMRKSGLEWLYRFIQAPRRLFSRYFITNSWFVFRVLKEFLTGK